MTTEAQRLLDLLVRCIRDGLFVPGKPATYLGDKKCHDLLGLPCRGGTWGRSLKLQGLNALAEWLQSAKVPAITGLIVDTTKGFRPAHGFFRAFNDDVEDDEWWREEVRRAIAYNWSAYSADDEPPTRDELRFIELLYTEGQRATLTSEVRTRCEALVKRAKGYFRSSDGELRCTVCNWSRPSSDLRGDIVEIHHLQPITRMPQQGVRWTFSEALRYLSPLCPNCHRVAHASPSGEQFTIDALIEMMK